MSTYMMRAWDPAGEEFVDWSSDKYDVNGDDYTPGVAFNTLENVHAVVIFESTGGGVAIENGELFARDINETQFTWDELPIRPRNIEAYSVITQGAVGLSAIDIDFT